MYVRYEAGGGAAQQITCVRVKNIKVTDGIIERDSTEYSSHALAEVEDGENRNEWISVTRSRIGK